MTSDLERLEGELKAMLVTCVANIEDVEHDFEHRERDPQGYAAMVAECRADAIALRHVIAIADEYH